MKRNHRTFIQTALLGCSLATIPLTSYTALSWQEVTIPNLPPGTDLAQVWTRGLSEVYVWGTYQSNSVSYSTLYRWDGASWSAALDAPGE